MWGSVTMLTLAEWKFRRSPAENECMDNDEIRPVPLGARLFPGVDLNLWFTLLFLAVLGTTAIVCGVVAAIH
jgi:hypothetical protein